MYLLMCNVVYIPTYLPYEVDVRGSRDTLIWAAELSTHTLGICRPVYMFESPR